MKVLFVIAALIDAGGAERVLTLMANHWADRGWQVGIATFEDGSHRPFYPLKNQVKCQAFNLPLKSSSARQEMGQRTRSITDRFGMARIMEKWDDLVYTVIDD